MKMELKCVQCFLRQAVKASRLATPDFTERLESIKEASKEISKLDKDDSPPITATKIFKTVIKCTGNKDAYAKLKKGSNETVLKLLDRAKELIDNDKDRLAAAVKLSLAGNIIDYGILQNFDVEQLIEDEIKIDIDSGKIEQLRSIIKKSSRLVFLSDNAGEIGLDGLLLKEFKNINRNLDIIIFVNKEPIINDVTKEDVQFFGLDKDFKIVEINTAVGLDYDNLDEKAKSLYDNADYILSKGQANYEILSESERENIIFLLRAKCDVIADYAGVKTGTPLFRFSSDFLNDEKN